MLDDWKSRLQAHGATLDEGGVIDFGNPAGESAAALTGNVISDLSHYGLIAVTGADAGKFLQGQFSNDVERVSREHAQLNAWCNPKGRMLAILLLFQRDHTFCLRLPRQILDGFLRRLRLFVLRADVALDDTGDQLSGIGLSGPGVAELLHTALGEAPPARPYEMLQNGGLTIIAMPGPQSRFEIHGDPVGTGKLWTTLEKEVTPVGRGPWELLDIVSGIPVVHPETIEAFVPQMANLDLIDGVDFKKGCYPGQEIVARMKYLGKLKRRMYLGRLKSDSLPRPGMDLFPASGDTSQPAGTVVSSQPHPDGGYAALAVLRIEAAESDELHLGDAGGPVFRMESLPYSPT